jgi:micrococcal nuclease
MFARRHLGLFAVLAAVALLGGSLVNGGIGSVTKAGRAPDPSVARVVSVVDGDTIRVRYVSGHIGPVRYIGIDTPETPPDGQAACYGEPAARFNAGLVSGERVRLIQDRDRRDRYGRLLAYVYRERDRLFVNAELVRRGYAQPLTIPPNVTYAKKFRTLASQARSARRGLWAHCPI